MSEARRPDAGFTLFETLLAFAMFAGLAGVVALAVFDMVDRQGRMAARIEADEAARALLTEYVETWPAMVEEGTYRDRWRWRIEEVALPREDLRDVGLTLDVIRVEIAIEDLSGPGRSRLVTATVRRAE